MTSLHRSPVETNKKELNMETLTIGIKAKLDIINNDMEEVQNELQDLEWKLQEIESLVNELEEIKELLTKLGKALGVELV